MTGRRSISSKLDAAVSCTYDDAPRIQAEPACGRGKEDRARMNFEEELKKRTRHADEVVCSFLPAVEGADETLLSAMNYSVRAGGKRLRPLMIESTCRMYGGNEKLAEPFMAAMEMIHTHSLVHDDLPAMDNDEYRRGKKTTHVVYGEAMAILAGDGLLSLGYETAAGAFARCSGQETAYVAKALQILSQKTGPGGMLGGQSVDVELDGQPLSEEQIDYIYSHKTGALIEASLMIGAVLAGAPDTEIAKLEAIGTDVGNAFQIRDDILDMTETTEELGKPAGSDERNKKTTYAGIHGVEAAEETVRQLSARALRQFDDLEAEEPFLRALLASLTNRRK